MSDLYNKGLYNPINEEFLLEGHLVLKRVAEVQKKWGKGDTDTFINELRDSMIGYFLGYNLVNVEKHGFDCKMNQKENVFLEVKSASFSSSTWAATFNDTTVEKAQCFQTKSLFLSLALWDGASNLLFVAYGQNKELGLFLAEKVKRFLSGKGGVRSTQTISLLQLVTQYGFDIICPTKSKAEVKRILRNKSSGFNIIPDSSFLTLEEYGKKYNRPYREMYDLK